MNKRLIEERLERAFFTFEEVLRFDKELDDLFFGDLNIIESSIRCSDSASYANLDTRALLTSYVDYFKILKQVSLGETLVDLGSGYSRGTFLAKILDLPKCLGLEFQKERVDYSKRNYESFFHEEAKNIFLCDLKSDQIPISKNYFLYFPKGLVLDRILFEIYRMKNNAKLFVIESHGDIIPYLKNLKFLDLKKEMKCSLPRHNDKIYMFSFITDRYNFDLKKDLSSWLIQNYDKPMCFQIRLHNYLNGDDVIWLVPKNMCFIEEYRERPHLNFKGRLIDIFCTEELVGLSSDGYNDLYQNYQNLKVKKIIQYENKLLIETLAGEFQASSFLISP